MLTDAEIAEGQRLWKEYKSNTYASDPEDALHRQTDWRNWADKHAEALLTGYVELQFFGKLMDGIIGELQARVKELEAQLNSLRNPPMKDWGRLDSN